MSLLTAAASPTAEAIDALFYFILVCALLISLAVFSAIAFFAVRYRADSPADRSNPPETNLKYEFGWSSAATILALTVFGWSSLLYVDLMSPKGEPELELSVLAKQWMWKVVHPSGKRELNSVHLPQGKLVRISLSSKDVIHSFFAPSMRIKQDAVPGMYTALSFRPTKVGEFNLFCAEYCGAQHSQMRGKIVVMPPDEYEVWSQSGAPPVRNSAGQSLYSSLGCSACHDTAAAPDLAGVYRSRRVLEGGAAVVADEQYLRESIMRPDAKVVAGFPPAMTSYQGRISEEELDDLIRYLKGKQ